MTKALTSLSMAELEEAVAADMAVATNSWSAFMFEGRTFSALLHAGDFESAEDVRLAAVSHVEASYDALARGFRNLHEMKRRHGG